MYKPVRLDAQDRVVQLGVQGKAEQQLGGAEWLGGAEQRLGRSEQRLGRAGEAAELCGAAELLGAQGKAEQRLGGAERRLGRAGRRQSFVERQRFWVFPLHKKLLLKNSELCANLKGSKNAMSSRSVPSDNDKLIAQQAKKFGVMNEVFVPLAALAVK